MGEVSSYQYFNLLADIVAVLYIIIFLKVKPKRYAFYTAIMFIVLGLAGARLLWACYDLENRFKAELLFKFDYGLMDLGGAFLVFPLVLFIANKLFKIKYKELFEVMIEALILASAIAKVACFSVDCCSGIPTDLPWAVNGLHPVQLYETGIWIIVYIVVMLTKNKMNNINRICMITIGCILLRMPIETLRADSRLFIDGGYWIAYQIVIGICIIALIINNRKNIKISMIVFLVSVVALLVGIVVSQKHERNITENPVENNVINEEIENNGQEALSSRFVEVQEDGIKINTSSELNKIKTIDGLEISNIKLKKVGSTVTLLADIKNTNLNEIGDYFIDIIWVDDMGKELDRIVGYIDKVKPNEIVELNASGTTGLFDYIYDIKIKKIDN